VENEYRVLAKVDEDLFAVALEPELSPCAQLNAAIDAANELGLRGLHVRGLHRAPRLAGGHVLYLRTAETPTTLQKRPLRHLMLLPGGRA
jgi:hypothetical protein